MFENLSKNFALSQATIRVNVKQDSGKICSGLWYGNSVRRMKDKMKRQRLRGGGPLALDQVRVEAKNPALLSGRDGYLLELTGWTKGSQAS